MRALSTVLAGLTALFSLAACNTDRAAPTEPTATPTTAVSLGKAATIDPSHTYRFAFTCSRAAENSEVAVYAGGPIVMACNSWTDRGPAYGTSFLTFDYETKVQPSGQVCSENEVAATGTYRCRSQKYAASLTVTDLGVVTP